MDKDKKAPTSAKTESKAPTPKKPGRPAKSRQTKPAAAAKKTAPKKTTPAATKKVSKPKTTKAKTAKAKDSKPKTTTAAKKKPATKKPTAAAKTKTAAKSTPAKTKSAPKPKAKPKAKVTATSAKPQAKKEKTPAAAKRKTAAKSKAARTVKKPKTESAKTVDTEQTETGQQVENKNTVSLASRDAIKTKPHQKVDKNKTEGEKQSSKPIAKSSTPKTKQDKARPSPDKQPREAAEKTASNNNRQGKIQNGISAVKNSTQKPGADKAKQPANKQSVETEEKVDNNKKQQGEKPKKANKGPAPKHSSPKSKQNKDTSKRPSCKLLINAEEPEECRIALIENGKLEAFYIESASRERTKGNIYKGKIVSIETNLQAAFVDIGTGKNAFLPFSEIHPEYYSKELPSDLHWKDVDFKARLKIGQEILLEVVKETTGNKGANMTSFLSLPGRYVVLMPGSDSHGISRQIDSQDQRRKLREMLDSCKLPEGVGYIIRTASKGITKTALTQDVRFLIKLWKDIRQRGQSTPAPALIYGEQNIVTRFLRDHFSSDIQEIQVDSKDAFEQVNNFLDLLPKAKKRKTTAKLHKGPRPLLNSHNIEEQIEQIYRPNVKLPSGGSIVIDPTEALVAIDVNSGSTGKDKKFAETIFLANMEAAEELTRQLRLRDLGGLIVVDFIDMRSSANIRAVEKMVKDSMKRDKAKVAFERISKFGLMQISRQRMGAPIAARNYVTCECCKGRGIIRSVETQALTYLRQIQTGCARKNVTTIRCHLPIEVSQYLLNNKRHELSDMERRYKVNISVEIDSSLKPAEANIEFLKET